VAGVVIHTGVADIMAADMVVITAAAIGAELQITAIVFTAGKTTQDQADQMPLDIVEEEILQ